MSPESLELLHVATGFVAAAVVAWLNTDRSTPEFPLLRQRMLWYFPWLVGRILHSGCHLSALILSRELPIDPRLIRYQTRLKHGRGIVLLGNSITLTPGTLTAEVNAQELVVHAMDAESAEDVTSGRIEKQISAMYTEGEAT